MAIREQLDSIVEKRLLILDGAMGSMIQTLNLSEDDFRGSVFAGHPKPLKGCNDLLCLTKPEAIGAIHDAYLKAGADIIETCSFNATSVSLSDYGLGAYAYEISAAAAKIARASADKFSVSDKPRFVAGSIGPTAKGASLYPDIYDPSKRAIGWDELEAAYYDNARGLLDGGADILLVETVFDTLNAKAALFAISRLLEERRADVPVMISATVSGESGRLLSGQTLEAFCISVLHANPWAIGLNCSFGAEKLLPHIRLLSDISPCAISAYPNAGFPNQHGVYEETPECMAAHIETYLKEGLVNIIGGCCGTTPAHIAAIAEKASTHKPRRPPDISRFGRFTGFEPLVISGGVVSMGDNKEFLSLANEGEFEDAADAARDTVEAGAAIIDIALDDENALGKFLDYALLDPYIAKVPFMINSLRWEVLEGGLKRLQGRGLAKAINLKDGDEAFVRKAQLIRRYGAAAVVTLVDEQGEAATHERQIAIAERVCQLLQKKGYPLESLIFAPAPPIENFCSWIKENYPGVLVLR
jgi:5-methyltetrahydrofolate--homocysteine methyltransferase